MAFPRNSLRAFLAHAKSSLQQSIDQSRKITIVTGNESADLDSLTSSVIYALFRSLSPPKNAFSRLYVPFLNVKSADINLRPEFEALFHHANISVAHIITQDDIAFSSDSKKHLAPENTRWILVDHNKLPGQLDSIYGARVHGTIDHHAEEDAVMQDTDPEPRILEEAGSCTSLVVRYFSSTWDDLSSSSLSSGAGHAQGSEYAIDDSAVTQGWDAQIAKFAIASILVDTVKLTSESKTAAVDREMAAYLEAKINLSPKHSRTWNRDEFYDEIMEAKQAIGKLRLSDVWRKDYKQWTEKGMVLGMSSVVKPLQFLSSKAVEESDTDESGKENALIHELEQHMERTGIDIFVIMTVFTDDTGRFTRELCIQAKGPAVNAAETFAGSAIDELGLEATTVPGIIHKPTQKGASDPMFSKTWLQRNVAKSRKQVGPLVRHAMR